jgi:phosphoribosylglycinamide formyltransferase-1
MARDKRARAAKIPCSVLNGKTHPVASKLDRAMLDLLECHDTELILLAGYMKCLGPLVVTRYRNRILNIHPALLPKYGGRGMYGSRVHEAVLAAQERETGVTIHLVDEEYDHGAVLAQARVPVQAGDTVESLGARVLQREHEFLIETLDRVARHEITLPSRN